MANCPKFVIWSPVPAGSVLKGESSALHNGVKSADYNAHVHIVPPHSAPSIDWPTAVLDPGPASLPLVAGGYGFTGDLASGGTGPTATLHMWIEDPTGKKLFDCTWTNGAAGTLTKVVGAIVVVP